MVSETRVIGILTGPTATGKSTLALELAQRFGRIEIINADSLLVYRQMNIGTAKPSPEELKQVPHHLIDIRNPDEPFTAGEFFRAAEKAIEEIHQRGNRPLIVGGTGFYLKSLLFGLWEAPPADPSLRESLNQKTNPELLDQLTQIDPDSALRIGGNDRYRLIRALELHILTGKTPTELQSQVPQKADPRFRLWVIDRENSELHTRIHLRTQEMLKQGLINEFEGLQRLYPKSRALSAIGYAQVSQHLQGITPPGRKIRSGMDGLADEVELATRQLVKSQRTWFRSQSAQVSQSEWFSLDQDRARLEEAFKSVYT
jgi:tRNA dimethylallyltransferase